jgi:hypothetical protein
LDDSKMCKKNMASTIEFYVTLEGSIFLII